MTSALTVAATTLAQAAPHSMLGTMLWLAIVFFVLAIVAWALGARGTAGMSAGVGRAFLWVFLVLAIVFLVLNFIPSIY